MKKLLRYLKDYRKESVLGPLFKLLEATLELFVPLVVAAIIDTGIGNQDRSYVVKMLLSFLFCLELSDWRFLSLPSILRQRRRLVL